MSEHELPGDRTPTSKLSFLTLDQLSFVSPTVQQTDENLINKLEPRMLHQECCKIWNKKEPRVVQTSNQKGHTCDSNSSVFIFQ